MADITEFFPVLQENANTIRARIDADLNAGLDPTDPDYTDTTPGGWYYDETQPLVLEIERLYDTMGTDVPASMLPKYAWGVYLDEHGQTVGRDRNDASRSTGIVTFSGTDGALVATGTQVATTQIDPDADPIIFETTASGTISGGQVQLPVQAVAAGGASNVAAGQLDVLLSANDGVSAVTNPEATTGGADVENDEKYRKRVMLEWTAAHGGGTIGDYESIALDYPGVGFVKVTPIVQGPGTVKVSITDTENHPLSQTVVDGLQNLLDPPTATGALSGAHTLPDATLDLASTAGFNTGGGRVRIGNQIVSFTGITGNTLTGCTGGSGTFADGTPVYQAGGGGGAAPVGAVVIVDTPAAIVVDVAATGIVFETGYSLDGTGGTIATRADITEAMEAYLGALRPGDDVIVHHLRAQAFLVPGVLDVPSLTIDPGGAGAQTTNYAVDDSHVAAPGMVTLS